MSPYPSHAARFGRFTLPKLIVPDGSVEALKWMALLLMTVDHINKFLFNGTNELAFAIGRVAMPLFMFVLAYNLARPFAIERGVYQRTSARLALFGTLSVPIFFALGGASAALRPLNIMFTLLVLTATLFLAAKRTTRGYISAAIVFGIGSADVEFWWPAVAFGVAVWSYRKHPTLTALSACCLALAALWFIEGNRNFWALAALPVVWLASRVDMRIPRLRWVFYAYYPGHLLALWFIRIPMRKAGYLFF